ncbi:MAG TPA: flagellin [Symbiobacteriaceae bacterium]|nr:flagellin [Symbiobacteriaceae bacterium]
MRINTNVSSLNAWRNLTGTDSLMSKNLERLSSGYRINRAGDDVAGLAISENMRAQIKGLNQAVKNAQDGISLLQTAEGSLNEVHTMLHRMRELAVQAANGTLQPEDRKQIQTEMDNLAKEVTRITNATQFNSKDLIDGSLQDGNIASVNLQIGPNGGQTVNFSIGAMDAKSLGISRDVLIGNVDNGAMAMAARASGGSYVAGGSISTAAGDVTNLGGAIDATKQYRVVAPTAASLQLEKSFDGGATWTKVGAAVNTTALALGATTAVGDSTTGETMTVELALAGNAFTAGDIDMVDFSGGTNFGGGSRAVAAIGAAGAGLADTNYQVFYDSTTQKMQLRDASGATNIGAAVDVSALAGETVTLGDANTARTLEVTVGYNLVTSGTSTDTITMSSSSGKVVDAKAVLTSVVDSSNLLANGAYQVYFVDAATDTIQLRDASGRAIGAAVTFVANTDITIGDENDGRTVTVHTANAAPVGTATATIQVTNNSQSGETAQFTGGVKYANSRAFAGLNVSSVDGAQAAIAAIDTAIGKVSYQRSQLGAIENRLDHTIKNLEVVSENLTASESRIRDVDMALEMTQFTKQQILMQSGTAMLAQANQKNQAVLSLLR